MVSAPAALLVLLASQEPGAAPKGLVVEAPAPTTEPAKEASHDHGMSQTDPAESAEALELAFVMTPQPEILLALAAVYERWPGHCDDARQAYERFLHTCLDCPARAYGVERFDKVSETCLKEPKVAEAPAAAVTSTKTVSFDDALKHFGIASTLNFPSSLPGRADALAALRSAEPTPGRLKKLLSGVGDVDASARARLMERLLAAEQSGDDAAYDDIRHEAVDILSRGGSREGQGGCFAVATGDPGYLTIDTIPWSEIYVNGVRRGTTPASRIELPAGCVSVRAVNPATNASVVRTVTIRPNAVAIYQLELNEDSARLRYRKRD